MPFKNVQSLQNTEHWDKFTVQAHKHTCATFIYINHYPANVENRVSS